MLYNKIGTLFILFIIGMTLFIYREKNTSHPLIDLNIFKSIPFSIGLLCAVLIFSSNLLQG